MRSDSEPQNPQNHRVVGEIQLFWSEWKCIKFKPLTCATLFLEWLLKTWYHSYYPNFLGGGSKIEVDAGKMYMVILMDSPLL